MQVGVVEQDPRLRRMGADVVDRILCDVVAGDVDRVEFGGALFEEFGQRQVEGGDDDLYPVVLQVVGVGAQMGEVLRQEGDLVAQRLHQFDFAPGGVGPCIAILAWGGVVDEEDPADDAAVPFKVGALPLLAESGIVAGPTTHELGAVDLLVALEAGRNIGAACRPLEKVADGGGDEPGLVASLAHLEGEIGILEIHRFEVGRQAAHLVPDPAGGHQGGTRQGIGLARVAEPGIPGVGAVAVIPGISAVPDDAARILQLAIGVKQLGPGQPNVVEPLEGVEQGIEPAHRRFGVVVEQRDVFAACLGHTGIAGADEALRLGVVDDPDARDDAFQFGRFVGRGVVDHDDLEAGLVVRDQKRRKRVIRDLDLVVGGHDHADLGLRDLGKGDRAQLDGFEGAIERARRSGEGCRIETGDRRVQMRAQGPIAVVGAHREVGGEGRTGFTGHHVMRRERAGRQHRHRQEHLAAGKVADRNLDDFAAQAGRRQADCRFAIRDEDLIDGFAIDEEKEWLRSLGPEHQGVPVVIQKGHGVGFGCEHRQFLVLIAQDQGLGRGWAKQRDGRAIPLRIGGRADGQGPGLQGGALRAGSGDLGVGDEDEGVVILPVLAIAKIPDLQGHRHVLVLDGAGDRDLLVGFRVAPAAEATLKRHDDRFDLARCAGVEAHDKFRVAPVGGDQRLDRSCLARGGDGDGGIDVDDPSLFEGIDAQLQGGSILHRPIGQAVYHGFGGRLGRGAVEQAFRQEDALCRVGKHPMKRHVAGTDRGFGNRFQRKDVAIERRGQTRPHRVGCGESEQFATRQ